MALIHNAVVFTGGRNGGNQTLTWGRVESQNPMIEAGKLPENEDTVVTKPPDARTGNLFSTEFTSGPSGVVSTVVLPSGIRGFRIFPKLSDVKFSVNESPSGISTTTFTPGGIAKAGLWESRLLESRQNRTLYIYPAASGMTVDIEVF